MPTLGRDVEIVAHRGASIDAPEHTFAAYDLALEQGADRIELDLRRTAGDDVVVHHDATLARTAGDGRAVARLTRDELDALAPVARPLVLDEVFARYGSRTRWLVDLKGPDERLESAVAAALARHGLGGHAVVQAFDHGSLARLKRTAPWVAVAPLYYRPVWWRSRLTAVGEWAGAIAVNRAAITQPLVDRAHAHGLGIRAWTVNDPAEARRLAALGVDGLITDAPARIREALGRARPVALEAA